MIVHVANLIRWEWFKTGRRRLPWMLLAIPVLFTQLVLWSTYFSYQAPISINSEMHSSGVFEVAGESGPTRQRVEVRLNCDDVFEGRVPSNTPEQLGVEDFEHECRKALREEQQQRTKLLDRIILPGSLVNSLTVVHGISVILVAILTASLIGSEFGWGTLRMVLSRGTGRWQILTAKLVLIALLAAAGLAIASLATAVGSLVMTSLVSERPEQPVEWADAAATFGRAWFALLPYAALAALVAVVASSTVAEITAAVTYLFTEWIVAALILNTFDWAAQNVADFMLGRNITAWLVGSEGGEIQVPLGTSTHLGEFPDMWQAFLVLSAYVAVMGLLAFWSLHRKDVVGASGA